MKREHLQAIRSAASILREHGIPSVILYQCNRDKISGRCIVLNRRLGQAMIDAASYDQTLIPDAEQGEPEQEQ